MSATSEQTFAALVLCDGAAVHGYLARRAGRQVADELLGEVWLRAFRSRDSFDRSWVSARLWLYGIARNTLRAHWRLRTDHPEPPLALTVDPWADADDRLDAERCRPALKRALDSLAEVDREMLLLVAWEQLTPAEAAIALSIPQGTARSRLHRARRSLQAHLDEALANHSLLTPEA